MSAPAVLTHPGADGSCEEDRVLDPTEPFRLDFRFEATVPVRARQVFRTAAKNAAKRRIEWALSTTDCARLWKQADGACQLTGLPFDLTAPVDAGRRRPFAPSLDRIDNRLGYTVTNVRLVSIVANLALNEWGLEPVVTFARALVAQMDHAQEQQIRTAARRWRAKPIDRRPTGWQTVRERWPHLAGPQLGRASTIARDYARRLEITDWIIDVDTGTRRSDGTVVTREERVFPPALLDEVAQSI